MNERILVVDDEPKIVKLARDYLERSGYLVLTAGDGRTALSIARSEKPDLVVLDLNLPELDGLDVCRTLRRESDVPIIMLTARIDETDRLIGLELGADDYITKPFNPDVLLAHVKAVLRRTAAPAPEPGERPLPITVGDLIIDPAAHTVHVAGQQLDLPAKEFAVLYTLAQEAGYVVAMDDLLNRVWGAEFLGEPQVVYVHVRWLREKIEEDPQKPQRLLTVRGVGYKLVPHEVSKE